MDNPNTRICLGGVVKNRAQIKLGGPYLYVVRESSLIVAFPEICCGKFVDLFRKRAYLGVDTLINLTLLTLCDLVSMRNVKFRI